MSAILVPVATSRQTAPYPLPTYSLQSHVMAAPDPT